MIKAIDPSDLNRRITIQTMDGTLQTNGVANQTWSDWKNVWAALEPSMSYEVLKARERFSQMDALWTIRWFKTDTDQFCGVNAQMRIAYKNQIFEIIGVEPVGMHDAIKIYCKKFGDGEIANV